MPKSLRCPDCGALETKSINSLPDVEVFAGRRVDRLLPGGALYRCADCQLRFRWPTLPWEELSALYESTDVSTWREPDKERPEWQIVRRWIKQLPGKPLRVLDVGCHTGDLLASLSDDAHKFGVEPNSHARAVAAVHCVETWPSVEDIPPGTRFDVIVATDVLEHVPQPSVFIQGLFELMAPDGRLMLATGDADAPLARLAGAHWWYCFWPEHLSFVSRAWFEAQSRRGRLQICDSAQYAHGTLHGMARLRSLALALAYAALGRRYLALMARLYRLLGRDWAPSPHGRGVTSDHLIVALRRP